MTLGINGKTYDVNELIAYHKKLEKENAELKEKYVKECEDVSYAVTNYSKQLTKAKEIIKSFITLLTKSRTALDTKTCLMKAEQFLKENE